jgi:hypothetical protein
VQKSILIIRKCSAFSATRIGALFVDQGVEPGLAVVSLTKCTMSRKGSLIDFSTTLQTHCLTISNSIY